MKVFESIKKVVEEFNANDQIQVKIELGDPISKNIYKIAKNELDLNLKKLFDNVYGLHKNNRCTTLIFFNKLF